MLTEIFSSSLIKEFGTAALMFGCFYLILKLTEKNLAALITQQKDFITQTFDMLKRMIETNLLNTALLQKINDKIDTNQWCPFAKDFLKDGEINKERISK